MNQQRSNDFERKAFIVALFLIVVICVASPSINTDVINKVLPVLKPTPSSVSQETFPVVGNHPAWIVIPALCILFGVLSIPFYGILEKITNNRGDWGCSILLVLAVILILAVLILNYK